MNTTLVFLAIIIAGISTITFIEGKSVSTGKYSARGKVDRYYTKPKINRLKNLIKRKFIVPIILRVANKTSTTNEITERGTQEAVTEDDDSRNSTGITIISISLICCINDKGIEYEL